jgi:exosortase
MPPITKNKVTGLPQMIIQETQVVKENHIDGRLIEQIDDKKSSQGKLIMLFGEISLLSAMTVWAYWPTIRVLFHELQRDDNYSAGQLVPLVALFVLWFKRKTLRQITIAPFWPALILLILAQAANIFGLVFMYESAQRYSFVLSITALTLLVAGMQFFKKIIWILLFLFLMVPLPGQVHNLISAPLQNSATTGAVFLLEALGAKVIQQGNTITLNGQTTLAVAEACSGLRMLTAFIIVASFVAFMIKRSRVQKAIVLFSSIPVGVMCNIFRLCITAVLFTLVSTQAAEKFFHDFAGVVMMPAAVLLIFGELWIMKIITVTESPPQESCIIHAKKS